MKDVVFRKAILELGGVKVPSDYEYLPHWCKRKKGMPIDQMVDELHPWGYWFEDANDLYNYLINH